MAPSGFSIDTGRSTLIRRSWCQNGELAFNSAVIQSRFRCDSNIWVGPTPYSERWCEKTIGHLAELFDLPNVITPLIVQAIMEGTLVHDSGVVLHVSAS
jgi:hypothetical protein